MFAWDLPTSLKVGEITVDINTDFRQILNILVVFNDPELTKEERWLVALNLFYKDKIPNEYVEDAIKAMVEFIDAGVETKAPNGAPSVMDWEQDAPLIIPAVNRTLGYECRNQEYLHWWTFLGGYMEIGECLFSTVVNIRQKKVRGKKLEEHEKEFERHNKNLIEIKRKLTEEEQAQSEETKSELKNLLGL